MKVTLVSDSCFIFEHEGLRLLTDPWIGTSIYGGAWIQFPQPKIRAEEIGRLDYIFISHIHEDHCDPVTISKLDRNARVILMDRQPNHVDNFLKYHDFGFREVILLKPREILKISDHVSVEVIEADPKHKLNHLLDSSLLIHYGEKSIYFANDNPPYPEIDAYLKRYDFDLVLLPPAGGSGYPAFYRSLDASQKALRRDQIIERYLNELLGCIRRLAPRLFACAASSHVLSGKSWEKNYDMAWPTSAAVPYRFVKEKLGKDDAFLPLLMNSGCPVDLDTEQGSNFDEAIAHYENREERDRFIMETASQIPYFYESFQLMPSVRFDHLLEVSLPRWRRHLSSAGMDLDWTVQVALPDGSFGTLSLTPPYDLAYEGALREDRRLGIFADPRLLFFLLAGGFSWNIADAAGYIEYDRKPDEFIQDIYIALNHLRI